MQDATAAGILERLSDLENHPDEALTPYEEFEVRDNIYYFTPGGFLYRKDPGERRGRRLFLRLPRR